MSRKVTAVLLAVLLLALGAATAARVSQAPEEPATRRLTEVDEQVGVDKHWLEAQVDEIARDTDTELGIVLIDDDYSAISAGDTSMLRTWSTIKVPIAFAALEHCDIDETMRGTLVTSMLEVSDNAATDQLWYCLETSGGAEKLVGEEIAKADADVEPNLIWGVSEWPVESQAKYGHYLAELADSEPDEHTAFVLDRMAHVHESQAWGLGNLDIPFKGGWSDAPDGSWESRQFGFGRIGDKRYGIAVAATSPIGSFSDTTDALDALANALATVGADD